MSQTSIAEKLNKIDELVAWFGGGEFDIDVALVKFEELTKLSEEVKVDLDQLENKVTVIKKRFEEI